MARVNPFFCEWRKRSGMTLDDVANAVGVDRGGLSRIERGLQGWTNTTIEALAVAYGLDDAADLFRLPESLCPVPLVGNVGAGGDVQRGDADMDYVEAPIGVPGKLAALRVEGLSMYPELQPGDLIFYDTADDRGPDTHIGHVVAIKTKDGDLLVKTLRRGSAPDVYDLHSHNPAEPLRENMRLKSAARVIFVDRPGRP